MTTEKNIDAVAVREATERVRHYLNERAKMRGLHQSDIHALNTGEDHEATLTVNDLRAITDRAATVAKDGGEVGGCKRWCEKAICKGACILRDATTPKPEASAATQQAGEPVAVVCGADFGAGLQSVPMPMWLSNTLPPIGTKLYLAAPISEDTGESKIQAAVRALDIQFEKVLCAKLGRDWSPTGISVKSLLAQLQPVTIAAPSDSIGSIGEDEEYRGALSDVIGCRPEDQPHYEVLLAAHIDRWASSRASQMEAAPRDYVNRLQAYALEALIASRDCKSTLIEGSNIPVNIELPERDEREIKVIWNEVRNGKLGLSVEIVEAAPRNAGVVPEGWREFIKNIATPFSEPLNSISGHRVAADRKLAMDQMRAEAQRLLASPAAPDTRDALTDEDLAEVAGLHCPNAYGFEGPETFPDCGKCVVCRARAILAKSKGQA